MRGRIIELFVIMAVTERIFSLWGAQALNSLVRSEARFICVYTIYPLFSVVEFSSFSSESEVHQNIEDKSFEF